MSEIRKVTITRPDDYHVHFRNGPTMAAVVPYTARVFGRALAMPNTDPELFTGDQAVNYYSKVIKCVPEGCDHFRLLTTIMLSDAPGHETTPETIDDAFIWGVTAAKLYPRGVTTGSGHGVANFLSKEMIAVYRKMAENGIVLCVHAEATHHRRLFRERDFIPALDLIHAKVPDLKIVVEHVSSREMCDWIWNSTENIGATVTAHHLLDTVDNALDSPHNLCNPVAKHDEDRNAVTELAINHKRVFFGSDSAPHPIGLKHCDRPACGVFSAPIALPLVAWAFADHGSLDKLEGFVSQRGADFYGIDRNLDRITLAEIPTPSPHQVRVDGSCSIRSYRAGEMIPWSVLDEVTI
jgi:dihydroorotase